MLKTRSTYAASLFVLAACSVDSSSAPLVTGVSSVSTAHAAPVFPEVLALPNGFRPEGIASGRGTTLYVGSLADGAIWQGDARTGFGTVLVSGEAGRVVVGIKYDARGDRLFAAGGPTGNAYVFDATTGATLATYQLASGGTFINDVVVTKDAAYFTNSQQAVLYRIPLGPGGALPDAGAVETIPLSGDFQQVTGFNANGIDATPDGSSLLLVHSTLGALYRVDPVTGIATRIDLGGANVAAGDGILLEGSTLYVVQNRLNQVAVVALSSDLTSGIIERTITDSDFRVPTTVARFGNALYLPNARFGEATTPASSYEVVRITR